MLFQKARDSQLEWILVLFENESQAASHPPIVRVLIIYFNSIGQRANVIHGMGQIPNRWDVLPNTRFERSFHVARGKVISSSSMEFRTDLRLVVYVQ